MCGIQALSESLGSARPPSTMCGAVLTWHVRVIDSDGACMPQLGAAIQHGVRRGKKMMRFAWRIGGGCAASQTEPSRADDPMIMMDELQGRATLNL